MPREQMTDAQAKALAELEHRSLATLIRIWKGDWLSVHAVIMVGSPNRDCELHQLLVQRYDVMPDGTVDEDGEPYPLQPVRGYRRKLFFR